MAYVRLRMRLRKNQPEVVYVQEYAARLLVMYSQNYVLREITYETTQGLSQSYACVRAARQLIMYDQDYVFCAIAYEIKQDLCTYKSTQRESTLCIIRIMSYVRLLMQFHQDYCKEMHV